MSTTAAKRDTARPAPKPGDGPTPASEPETVRPSLLTSEPTQTSASDGFILTENASESASLTSKRSEKPSRHWKRPSSARQLAAQVNAVATMLLNGQIDADIARSYGTLARTVAQSISLEVTRARFLAHEPNLDLQDDELFDEA